MEAKLKGFFQRLVAPAPIAIWLIGSMSVSLSGPFGTFEAFPYILRLTYWGSVIGLSIVIGALVRLFSGSIFPADEPVKQDILSIFMMTAVFSPLVVLMSNFCLPFHHSVPPSIAEVVFYVAAISTAVFVIRRLIPGGEGISYLSEPVAKPMPQLIRRLPDDFVGPILRLSVRDHFVDVVTPHQTFTIRMRFSDAVNEMIGVMGYCTHRSHWVAADAVKAVEQEGAKTTVRLVNGDVVPVSRKYRENVKEAERN